MARPPEVFVRPVTMTEGRRLQRIGRTAKDPVKVRRAIVVLMSAQGQGAALDLATGQMFYRIRERNRWREFLAFLKLLRSR